MTRTRRLFSGILLLLFFGGVLAFLGPFTLGRVVLDFAGTEVRGTVTGKHQGFYWNRLRGNVTAHRVVVAFRTEDHRSLTADYSVTRETFQAATDGAPLEVTYWAPVPRLSAIEPTPWDSPLFVGLFALALVLIWLCAMVMVRSFSPPRHRASR